MTPDELEERLFGAVLGTLDLFGIHIGDQLGLYHHLRGQSMTADELAVASGMHARYAREWLEQQCVSGLVEVDDPALAAEERRFSLSPDHACVLADHDNLSYFAPFARLVVAAGAQLPALLHAYRTGGGVGWADYGPLMRTAQADGNRPLYLALLGREWLPAVPEVDDALRRGGRLADIGCGEGWSSIGVAEAYPEARVDGFDVDAASIRAARGHVEERGLSGRVEMRHQDIVVTPPGTTYDVVTAFECVHDLPDPVGVLSAARELLAPSGTMLVMDERVPDEFTGPGDPVERLMYGFSMMVCLPDSLSHPGSVATGTVMRADTLRDYAIRAGFSGVDVLPIDNDLFRFYQLTL